MLVDDSEPEHQASKRSFDSDSIDDPVSDAGEAFADTGSSQNWSERGSHNSSKGKGDSPGLNVEGNASTSGDWAAAAEDDSEQEASSTRKSTPAEAGPLESSEFSMTSD
jgi:hypothetical protein